MNRTPGDLAQAVLAPLMPALLDALARVGIGIIIIADRGNGEFDRLYANDAAAATLGYKLEELLAIPVLETLAPEQRALVRQLATSFRAGQAVPAAVELPSLHKNGNRIMIEYVIGSMEWVDNSVVYVLLVRDGSKAAPELTLLEADRIGLVGALSAGFAHEINNPLTSVMLNLRSLRKHLGPQGEGSQAMRCIDDITIGAERIASNVRALQTLATRSASQEIDLAAVVSAALRLAAPTLEPCAHVIRQIFPVRPVIGEESRVGQAVLAMMLFSSSGFDPANTSASNRIVVAVEERGGDVTVEVSDNGQELSAEETRRAFDPFFRSPSRGAGVGVGLGVARSVAATLGGEVTLAARPGGGAVITMRLPAAERPTPG